MSLLLIFTRLIEDWAGLGRLGWGYHTQGVNELYPVVPGGPPDARAGSVCEMINGAVH